MQEFIGNVNFQMRNKAEQGYTTLAIRITGIAYEAIDDIKLYYEEKGYTVELIQDPVEMGLYFKISW